MKAVALALVASVMLASCATQEAIFWSSCQSVSSAERALRPYAPVMSDDEVIQVAATVMVARNVCQQGYSPTQGLTTIRDSLRVLVQKENELRARQQEPSNPDG